MKDPLFAECETRAKNLGLHLDTVNPQLGRDLWWLMPARNWATTRPGSTLAEIRKQLDALESNT